MIQVIIYYSFSGNADDVSGNGNDGTVSGAVLGPDNSSSLDSAFVFDGTDDFIEKTSPFNLNVGAPGEAWRFLQGANPCYSKSNQQDKPSVAHMKERKKAAGGQTRELVRVGHPKRGRRASR